MYSEFTKPILSRIGALISILILWPLMLLLLVIIRIDSPGNPLFMQERIGKDGKIFRIAKFRSMKENAFYEGTGAYTYQDDPRITRVGRLIRETSLDELPQLFNILFGDMCFIGPRPLLPGIPLNYQDYPPEFKTRFSVLPGMFCLVDVRYRAEATFETQCTLDVFYVNNITYFNDIKILFGTLCMVFLRKGIYSEEIISIENEQSEAV